jgi:hypothetical protein
MADTKTLIEQAYSAFNKRDIDGALVLMTEDVSWPKASEGGRVVGKEETVWNFGEYGAKRDLASANDFCGAQTTSSLVSISARIFCLRIRISEYFRTLRKY